MRTLSMVCLALMALLSACKKDDDAKFSSAEGDWTYTTADSKIKVDFTLKKDGSSWSVINPTMRVDGTETAKVVVQQDGLNPPSLQYLRFNVNDTKITYPYPIEFRNGTVNSDFTLIEVTDASYTWPNGQENALTKITITRK